MLENSRLKFENLVSLLEEAWLEELDNATTIGCVRALCNAEGIEFYL